MERDVNRVREAVTGVQSLCKQTEIEDAHRVCRYDEPSKQDQPNSNKPAKQRRKGIKAFSPYMGFGTLGLCPATARAIAAMCAGVVPQHPARRDMASPLLKVELKVRGSISNAASHASFSKV